MKPPPRKRRRAYNVQRQAHALTFSTYRRQQFFRDSELADLFRRRLFEAADKLEFDVWAFVVMPEHCHILLFPRQDDYLMANILKAIKSPFAKEVLASNPEIRARCKIVRGDDSVIYRFWQSGGGYDFNIYTDEKITNFISYCHNNPVRRGLCEFAQDWRWSSFLAYRDHECVWPVIRRPR